MKRGIGLLLFGVIVGVADLAHAQSGGSNGGVFGIGPRVTFQRGENAPPDASPLRLLGGQLKLRLSPGTAIEVAADYESSVNESLKQRVKTMPIQASLMVFPLKSTLAPYLLGGVGWYRVSVSDTGATATSTTTKSIREMGYHAGLGAEIRIRRIALHGDYRYNHIRFGGAGDDAPPAASLVPGLSLIQESLKMSHSGSMWNWGATFFF
jgi:hypothetical protein